MWASCQACAAAAATTAKATAAGGGGTVEAAPTREGVASRQRILRRRAATGRCPRPRIAVASLLQPGCSPVAVGLADAHPHQLVIFGVQEHVLAKSRLSKGFKSFKGVGVMGYVQ